MSSSTTSVEDTSVAGERPSKLRLVAVSGQAGCGKDYIVKYMLVPMLATLPWAVVSFADHFKFEAIVKEKLDRKKVFGRKDKETRSRLQKLGTEKGRDVDGPDIWIKILDEQLRQYEERGIVWVFITDCRFPNEIAYVESRGGDVIRIEAPDRVLESLLLENDGVLPETTHVSETSLSNREWRWKVDNTKKNSHLVGKEVTAICRELKEKHKFEKTIFTDMGILLSKRELVRPFITRLNEKHNLVVIDEGDLLDCIQVLYAERLEFLKLEAIPEKKEISFMMLMKKYPSREYVTIGRSTRSDFWPSLEAGIKTIYFVSESTPLHSMSHLLD